jgi:hypothetical protein
VRLLTLDQIDALPDPEFLIDGVLPRGSLSVLYGAPGCAKTFVALSMAMTIASGTAWLERQTRKEAVLYIAAEGIGGMKYRLRAYQRLHETDTTNIRILPEPIQLIDRPALKRLQHGLAAQNFNPDLVIVDTLARATVGLDENNVKDMSRVVEAADSLRRDLNSTVLLIHHTRKKGDLERGSSALRGAADVMIECKKTGQIVVATCVKMKDAEPFADIKIWLQKVDLGCGRSSLVAGIAPPFSKPTPKHVDILVEILKRAFANGGAQHSDLERAFCEQAKVSESTFARTLRDALDAGCVRKVGEGQQARYFPVGVSVK